MKTKAIIKAVCEYFGYTMKEFRSRSQAAHISGCRQVLAFMLSEYDRRSSNDIGRLLDRDHSTILHACEIVRADMPRRRRDIENIKAIVQMQGLL